MNNSTTPQLEELVAALNKSFALFTGAAEAYPREFVRSKPNEAAFSATEVVYHMLDVERLWQRRIRGLLDGTMITFQQMDPDKEAREGHYNEKDYSAGISDLKKARKETDDLVQSMKPEELLRSGMHSKYGEMDTYAILAKMEDHDRIHSAQLERTLRQVKP